MQVPEGADRHGRIEPERREARVPRLRVLGEERLEEPRDGHRVVAHVLDGEHVRYERAAFGVGVGGTRLADVGEEAAEHDGAPFARREGLVGVRALVVGEDGLGGGGHALGVGEGLAALFEHADAVDERGVGACEVEAHPRAEAREAPEVEGHALA